MDQPLVSVIVPVYNGDRYLRPALDSVFAQTYPYFEVVVVNDGSTDSSAQLIKSYPAPLVSINKTNEGVGIARNTGIRYARGQFIAFLDQDDLWSPTKLERQITLFEQHKTVGLVHTDVEWRDATATMPVSPPDAERSPELASGNCFEQLLLRCSICNSSVVVRSSILEQIGTCDVNIRGNTVQDYDLWLRIARVSALGYIDEKLTVIRRHSDQGSANYQAMYSETARLLEGVLEKTPMAIPFGMDARMGRLYDLLGVYHLEQGARSQARSSFRRAFRWHPTLRLALLFTCTFLPRPVVRFLQSASALRTIRSLFSNGAR